jgi:hypothetical protein
METKTKTKKSSMDFKIKGNWENQAKELKKKYPQLNESELKFESGKEMELVNRLAKSLHKKTDEIINILKKGQVE